MIRSEHVSPDAGVSPQPAARSGAFRWRGHAVDVLLGAAAALGQAPLGLWPLTIVAMAVIAARVARSGGPRTGFWRGLAAGAGYFALAMAWIVDPFLVEPEVYGWMAPFALLLMALGGAMFWAAPSAVAGWVSRRGGPRAAVVAMAAGLILSDWLRGWLFTGLPWALLGHVWIDTPVAQGAAWFGAVGLSTVTMIAATLPVLAGSGRRTVLVGTLLSALILTGLWVGGSARLAAPPPAMTGTTLRLIQPDATEGLKWDPEWMGVFYQRLLDLSSIPSSSGRPPDIVIWPETAVPFLLDQAGPALGDMARSAQGGTLIVGIQRREGARFYNSLIALDPQGAVSAVYDKFHLVPFGEYVPWGDLASRFGVGAFAAQQGFGYTPGPGARVLQLAGAPPVQPLICYEAVFSRHLREAPTRPGWLVQITNDSWFGTWSGPYQHLAQARLRAIESGLPLMRAANTGVSAAIDARGQIIDQLPLGQQGALDVALPGALPPTLWWRWGDLPAVLLAALMLVLSAVRAETRRNLPTIRTKQ